MLIAGKVSRDRETNPLRFSADCIMRQVECSLRRLRREAIDIYQLHSPRLAACRRDQEIDRGCGGLGGKSLILSDIIGIYQPNPPNPRSIVLLSDRLLEALQEDDWPVAMTT